MAASLDPIAVKPQGLKVKWPYISKSLQLAAAMAILTLLFIVARHAVMAGLAGATLRPAAWLEDGPADSVVLRGKVQKHFLTYGIYIPLSDIVAIPSETDANARLVFIMRKSCGDGMIYAWVPIQFRIPYFGVRTFEWCWIFPRPPIVTETRNLPQQKGLL